MIFRRALQREMVNSAGATFAVLFTVLVTWTLISILGKAAGGKVASSDVLALIAFAVLNYLPTILILTSFISVLAAVTRSYRDSEMVVWFASSLSLVRWIRPVLTFGLPIVALVGVLALVVTPWAKLKSSEFVERFQKREDLKRVAPGQFRESTSNDRVFFVESSTAGATVVQNVFVSTIENGANSIVVAKEGVIEADKGGAIPGAEKRPALPGRAGQGRFPVDGVRALQHAGGDQGAGAGRGPVGRCDVDAGAAGDAEPVYAVRAPVPDLVADHLPDPAAAGDPAGLCQSARRQLGQPDPRAVDLLYLQ